MGAIGYEGRGIRIHNPYEKQMDEMKELLIEAKEEILKLRHDLNQMQVEKRALAEKLYQNDRCNFCYDNDFAYKDSCKKWNRTCFKDFIDELEMEV